MSCFSDNSKIPRVLATNRIESSSKKTGVGRFESPESAENYFLMKPTIECSCLNILLYSVYLNMRGMHNVSID